MTGDLLIVAYQGAVVLGAILGYSAAACTIRRDRTRAALLSLAALAPLSAIVLAPGPVLAYVAAGVAGVIAAAAVAHRESRGFTRAR